MDPKESSHFQALADEWWAANGPFAPLHSLNPLRTTFILDALTEAGLVETVARLHSSKPLSGLKGLDMGCGGGLVTEPLARLGADVTAVDAVQENVATAAAHGARDPDVSERATYLHTTAEDLVFSLSDETGNVPLESQFDFIASMEVVEHVADVPGFLTSLGKLLRPGGVLVMSTLNRTIPGYVLGIVAAEQILGWVPPGTHEWTKFVTPQELTGYLTTLDIDVHGLAGVIPDNPFRGSWKISDNTAVNYMLWGAKHPTV